MRTDRESENDIELMKLQECVLFFPKDNFEKSEKVFFRNRDYFHFYGVGRILESSCTVYSHIGIGSRLCNIIFT